jgi:hypothetical protein
VARPGAGRSDDPSQADPQGGAGWPGARGEALEPLPPITGRSQGGSHRAGAWQPDVRSGRSNWDEYAEPSHRNERSRDWDREADYEGDTW